MISIIVAASTNNVIGVGGELPWKISDDLKRFKELTMGKPVVMGRLTWESIGRALPGRQNIVITRQQDFSADGCEVVTSPAAALSVAGDAEEIMIIGGSQVYDLFLPKADCLYVTRVQAAIDGDAFFPAIGSADWHLVNSEWHEAGDSNEFAFEFRVYKRKDRLRSDGSGH
jgi:dihydrofolate reductase